MVDRAAFCGCRVWGFRECSGFRVLVSVRSILGPTHRIPEGHQAPNLQPQSLQSQILLRCRLGGMLLREALCGGERMVYGVPGGKFERLRVFGSRGRDSFLQHVSAS